MRKMMIGNACIWLVLTATMAFAQRDGTSLVPQGPRESKHPPLDTNADVFWKAVADNSIAVIGAKSPQQGSVETAIVQIAVHDAVNAICAYPFTHYAIKPDVRVPALAEAAVAAAVQDVLLALLRSISSITIISKPYRDSTKENLTAWLSANRPRPVSLH